MPLLFLILFCISFFFPSTATAQSSPSFSVTPSLLQIDLRTEQPEAEIIYKNLSNDITSVELAAKDFSAFDEKGKVNLLDETDAKNYHYSLSSWIEFSTQAFSLNPG